ncbi:MAG: glycosyltransferase [Anaerolineae bacterium]|nr:glycosyltransferase [Anaerolineae bacterium]
MSIFSSGSSFKHRVALIGGESLGWALDKELELTRQSLPFIETANLLTCNTIHTISWFQLTSLPASLLVGRHIISHMSHDPQVAFNRPRFESVSQVVNLWIARSEGAKRLLDQRGLNTRLIPYTFNPEEFHPIPKDDDRLDAFRQKWSIPEDMYIIGSFQRDTEGRNLSNPKLVKGPDIFFEIVKTVWEETHKIHVLLAGPRRHWLRRCLEQSEIPFTFIGSLTSEDDIIVNNLKSDVVNLLYNLADLYLVSSRMEGGPQAVLEAAATRCKILSTNVGHAADILQATCIFEHPDQAIQVIMSDIQNNQLTKSLDFNLRSSRCHVTEVVEPLWKAAYDWLAAAPYVDWEQAKHCLDGRDLVPRVIAACLRRLKHLRFKSNTR